MMDSETLAEKCWVRLVFLSDALGLNKAEHIYVCCSFILEVPLCSRRP